ncbi:hypothetical protein [Spiroplasma endosymbiont of Glossina fuscipes fuscipes]|uniref:hypothetical protein n=1 Tax=Spiroplasma endosymbiont of Glossina fuscipes fuscipes TaxID=2004463 RepID=UPI003C76DD86
MEQLKFDFDSPKNNLTYIFENEMQEKLFYKIQENHSWKNKYMYGQEYWKEELYTDILKIDNNLLKDIYDLIFQILEWQHFLGHFLCRLLISKFNWS